jgi:hypothetical protein
MIKQLVPPLASGIGLVLLVLSFVWPSITDPNAVWTADQAQERADAFAVLHSQSCDCQACQAPASDEAQKQATERMRQSNVAFQAALTRRSRFVATLKWSGIAFVTIGVITLVATQKSTDKPSLDLETGSKS